jgi:sugar phosphate isomerase/epimerase
MGSYIMKLGFVTAIFPDLSLEEVVQFAAVEQFDNIEVMCWPPGGTERKFAGVSHIGVTDLSRAQADDVNALLDKHGLGISALGYYPNPLSNNPEEAQTAQDHLRHVIDAAPLLGLKNVNTFIGNDHTRNIEHNFVRFREVWPDLIKYAEDRDVYVGIENCPMLFSWDEWPAGKNMAYSMDIWRRMFEIIPSDHFGLNYDPSHFVLLMADYLKPIKRFSHKLFHTHAKDMRIERDLVDERGILALGWSTPKTPGLGDIDWGAWISALTDVGFDGDVSVEIEDEAFMRDLESRKKSLRLAHNVLRPLIV